jgi:hypothetical protein
MSTLYHQIRSSPARSITTTLVLLVAAVAVAAVLYRQVRMPGGTPGEAAAAEVCRAGYAHAAAAADSAAVDAQRPIVSRGQATVARSCRELRRAGALR